MSEKAFNVEFYRGLGYTVWEDNEEVHRPVVCVPAKYQAYKICDELNRLHEEIEQLKGELSTDTEWSVC